MPLSKQVATTVLRTGVGVHNPRQPKQVEHPKVEGVEGGPWPP